MREFSYVKTEDLNPEDVYEPKIAIDGEVFLLNPNVSGLDVVTFVAGAVQGGSGALVALNNMLRLAVDYDPPSEDGSDEPPGPPGPSQWERFEAVVRRCRIDIPELTKITDAIGKEYTGRPTKASSDGP